MPFERCKFGAGNGQNENCFVIPYKTAMTKKFEIIFFVMAVLFCKSRIPIDRGHPPINPASATLAASPAIVASKAPASVYLVFLISTVIK